MAKKCKHKPGDLVYIVPNEIENESAMYHAAMPRKYFDPDESYVVEEVGSYGSSASKFGHWRVLVHGSDQFVHEKCFSSAKPVVKISNKKRKVETITIDGKEYYLIEKKD